MTMSNYLLILLLFCRALSIEGFVLQVQPATQQLHATSGSTTGQLHQQEDSTSISILYESDDLLVINKPHQIPHHDSENELGILTLLRNLQSNGKLVFTGRLYGVHRLDKVTSGILLFAKNRETAQVLSNSFRTRSNITKYYIALSNKKAKKKKQGWVKGDMVSSRRGSWKLTNSMQNPAITRFYTAGLGNCDDSFSFSHSLSDDYELPAAPKTMILFQPLTGKTHQLRVSAKSLGLPIIGDSLYGDAFEANEYERTYLHAIAMHVKINSEDVVIWNPPDQWFTTKQSEQCEENSAQFIMYKLFNKYCTDSFILEAISNHKNEVWKEDNNHFH